MDSNSPSTVNEQGLFSANQNSVEGQNETFSPQTAWVVKPHPCLVEPIWCRTGVTPW